MAKFDPFLSLGCARVEGVGAQSKERKGSNFAALHSGAIVQKPEWPNTYDLKIWLQQSGNHVSLFHLRRSSDSVAVGFMANFRTFALSPPAERDIETTRRTAEKRLHLMFYTQLLRLRTRRTSEYQNIRLKLA